MLELRLRRIFSSQKEDIISTMPTTLTARGEFQKIEKFLIYYEIWLWDGSGLEILEDITSAFKLAGYLEAAYTTMQSRNSVSEYDVKLQMWFLKRKRRKTYKLSFFSKACDHLFKKILLVETMSDESIQKTIHNYLSVCSESRLCDLLEQLLEERKVLKAVYEIKVLIDSVASNRSSENDAKYIFQQLIRLDDRNNMDFLNEYVKKKMCHSSVLTETMLKTLCPFIGNNTKKENDVKHHVLNAVLGNISMDQDKCSQFWQFCSRVDQTVLTQVALSYPSFVTALTDFIVRSADYLSTKFAKDSQSTWEEESNELLILSKCVINSGENARGVIEKIVADKLKTEHNSKGNFWSGLAGILIKSKGNGI